MANKKRNVRVLVIAGGLALFAFLLLWLSRRSPLFTPTYRLFVTFESVSGLDAQSKVLMRGYPIGLVQGITFEPEGIVVAVDIEKKYRIPSGSALDIENFNLLGDGVINITPARSTEYLAPGARLHGENLDFMAEVRAALRDFRRTRGEFDWGKLDRTLNLADEAFTKLSRELSQLDLARVRADMNSALQATQEIRDDIKQSSERIGALSDDGRTVLAKFGRTLEAADRTQAALDRYLDKLASQTAAGGELLNDREFIANFKETLAEINSFFKEMKKNPKKFFKFSIF
jgi:phospholipid/cholesterol/gamma-HCH transport system substrate-binding protein